jgi:hypothetical protein
MPHLYTTEVEGWIPKATDLNLLDIFLGLRKLFILSEFVIRSTLAKYHHRQNNCYSRHDELNMARKWMSPGCLLSNKWCIHWNLIKIIFKLTWHHNSQQHQHLHCCENLKSHIKNIYLKFRTYKLFLFLVDFSEQKQNYITTLLRNNACNAQFSFLFGVAIPCVIIKGLAWI